MARRLCYDADMRLLGVDPGARRIGLALSDPDGLIATPLSTLSAANPLLAARLVAAEAIRLQVEKIVLGLPLHLDGREGDAARRSRLMAERLRALTALPVVLWDERLTTVAADRALREGRVRGKKRKMLVDQVAAALLLQSYLDAERWQDDPDR